MMDGAKNFSPKGSQSITGLFGGFHHHEIDSSRVDKLLHDRRREVLARRGKEK